MRRTIVLLLVMALIPFGAYCEVIDFLADNERFESTKELYNSIDYVSLEGVAERYIEAESPATTDSVYSIVEILEGATEAINAIDEIRDDFDGSRCFTLDGVKEIGNDYCVIPGYNTAEWLNVQMGFIADDWVFFDRIQISVDGEVVCEEEYDSSEKTTDILQGGMVLEKVSRPIDFIEFDNVEAIRNGQKAAIRFSNTSTGDKIDHVMTDQEKAALYHCWQLLQVRSALSDLYWDYSHGD